MPWVSVVQQGEATAKKRSAEVLVQSVLASPETLMENRIIELERKCTRLQADFDELKQ